MTVAHVILTLNVKTFTALIYVHVNMIFMVMVELVVISINVHPEKIVTRMLHAVPFLVITNVLVTMGLTVMANLVPTLMNVLWFFLVMLMRLT